MFIDNILNDKNFEIVTDKLTNVKDTYKKFVSDRTDFTDLVFLGTKNLVNGRILTGIPTFNGSTYSIGLNSKGLGKYSDGCDRDGNIVNSNFLSDLKEMSATEFTVSVVSRIVKKSKKTRFQNVIKALKKYECDEFDVFINRETSIIDPTYFLLNKSNLEDAKIKIKNFRIRFGELNAGMYYYLFNDSNNSISKFLVFDQIFNEVVELSDKYVNKMEKIIVVNRKVKDKLEDELSDYISAISI